MEAYADSNATYGNDDKTIGTLTSWQMLANNISHDGSDTEEEEEHPFDDDEGGNLQHSVHDAFGVSSSGLLGDLARLRSPSFYSPTKHQGGNDEGKTRVTPKQHHALYKEYRILNEIGAGAFGRVCLARKLTDGKEVVVKEIKTSQLSGKIKAATMDEVQVLASLTHPNIVKFNDCFMDDSYINIVMEYCNAGDLAKLLKAQQQQPLPEHHIMFLFIQICLALQYTHASGVLHRDLKTSNCMLMSTAASAANPSLPGAYANMPLLKLGDFGVAKVAGADGSIASTVVGTPQYMTPEMIDNKPYGRKSDVWALGCILYELCSLKKAFEGDRIPIIFYKIAQGSYDPLPDSCSQDMKDLVAKLLSRDVADRPTVQEILSLPFVRTHLSLYLDWARHVPEAQPQVLLANLGDLCSAGRLSTTSCISRGGSTSSLMGLQSSSTSPTAGVKAGITSRASSITQQAASRAGSLTQHAASRSGSITQQAAGGPKVQFAGLSLHAKLEQRHKQLQSVSGLAPGAAGSSATPPALPAVLKSPPISETCISSHTDQVSRAPPPIMAAAGLPPRRSNGSFTSRNPSIQPGSRIDGCGLATSAQPTPKSTASTRSSAATSPRPSTGANNTKAATAIPLAKDPQPTCSSNSAVPSLKGSGSFSMSQVQPPTARMPSMSNSTFSLFKAPSVSSNSSLATGSGSATTSVAASSSSNVNSSASHAQAAPAVNVSTAAASRPAAADVCTLVPGKSASPTGSLRSSQKGASRTSFDIWNRACVSVPSAVGAPDSASKIAAKPAPGAASQQHDVLSPFAMIEQSSLFHSSASTTTVTHMQQLKNRFDAADLSGRVSSVGAAVMVSVVRSSQHQDEAADLKAVEAEIQRYLDKQLTDDRAQQATRALTDTTRAPQSMLSMNNQPSTAHQGSGSAIRSRAASRRTTDQRIPAGITAAAVQEGCAWLQRRTSSNTTTALSADGKQCFLLQQSASGMPAGVCGSLAGKFLCGSNSFTEASSHAVSRRTTKETLSRANTTGSAQGQMQSLGQWLADDETLLQHMQVPQQETACTTTGSAYAGVERTLQLPVVENCLVSNAPSTDSSICIQQEAGQQLSQAGNSSSVTEKQHYKQQQPQEDLSGLMGDHINLEQSPGLQCQPTKVTGASHKPASGASMPVQRPTSRGGALAGVHKWVPDLCNFSADLSNPPAPHAPQPKQHGVSSQEMFKAVLVMYDDSSQALAASDAAASCSTAEVQPESSSAGHAEGAHTSSTSPDITQAGDAAALNSNHTSSDCEATALIAEQKEMLRLFKAFKSRMLSDQKSSSMPMHGAGLHSTGSTVRHMGYFQ